MEGWAAWAAPTRTVEPWTHPAGLLAVRALLEAVLYPVLAGHLDVGWGCVHQQKHDLSGTNTVLSRQVRAVSLSLSLASLPIV